MIPATLDRRDQRATPAIRAHKDPPVKMARKVLLANRDRKARQEQTEHKALPVSRARKVILVPKALLGPRETRESPVLRVRQENKGLLDRKAIPESKDPLVLLVQTVKHPLKVWTTTPKQTKRKWCRL